MREEEEEVAALAAPPPPSSPPESVGRLTSQICIAPDAWAQHEGCARIVQAAPAQRTTSPCFRPHKVQRCRCISRSKRLRGGRALSMCRLARGLCSSWESSASSLSLSWAVDVPTRIPLLPLPSPLTPPAREEEEDNSKDAHNAPCRLCAFCLRADIALGTLFSTSRQNSSADPSRLSTSDWDVMMPRDDSGDGSSA